MADGAQAQAVLQEAKLGHRVGSSSLEGKDKLESWKDGARLG